MGKIIYIVSHNDKYKTNKTNVTRLWEVFESEWDNQELEISYKKEENDTKYTTISARKYKIKQICIDAVENRIHIHPKDDMDDKMTVFRDFIGG